MSITTLEEAGYKVGDKVRLVTNGGYFGDAFASGTIGTIGRDGYGDLGVCLPASSVEKDGEGPNYPWYFFAEEIKRYEEPQTEPEDTTTYDLQALFDGQSKSERWFAFAPLFAGLVVLLLAGLVALFPGQ